MLDENLTSEGTAESRPAGLVTSLSARLRFNLRSLLLVTMMTCMLLAVGRWAARWAISWGEELHARSCLSTVTELADRTVDTTIPQRDFRKAIEAAAYIKFYYPAGAVLPKDHPFAQEYEAERQRQVRRIRDALARVVGDDDATVWREWSASVGETATSAE